jgi:hypothetical protein
MLAYLVEKREALEPQQAGSVGSVGAIPSFQFTTRQLQQQFNKSSWLAQSDNQAATLRGLLVQLSKDHWLQLMPSKSTTQGGQSAKPLSVNPKAPEIFNQLYS